MDPDDGDIGHDPEAVADIPLQGIVPNHNPGRIVQFVCRKISNVMERYLPTAVFYRPEQKKRHSIKLFPEKKLKLYIFKTNYNVPKGIL